MVALYSVDMLCCFDVCIFHNKYKVRTMKNTSWRFAPKDGGVMMSDRRVEPVVTEAVS